MPIEPVTVAVASARLTTSIVNVFTLPRKTISISIENHTSTLQLTNVSMYNNGSSLSPPIPIILHADHPPARFEGSLIKGTKGMLCYKIEHCNESRGIYRNSHYLLISWRVTTNRDRNQFCAVLHESKEPPLRGKKNEKKNFYKTFHRRNRKYPDESFYSESNGIEIGATISSDGTAEMKVQIKSCPEQTKQTEKIRRDWLRRILSFLICS